MQSYQDKTELIEEIKTRYFLYDQEFKDIKEDEKDLLKSGVDKTPSQNISYQIGWTRLLLQWEADEKKGLEVKTPTPEYKWNNLKGLYESFYQQYGSYSLDQQRGILQKQVDEIILWIESLEHKTLFVPEQRKWATTPAKWPVWKWIHINTVAPFKNFRSQLRKWKKETGTE
ncbi:MULTISPECIES: ClbS/DfsB family four-helix bundle protein [unclassified Chryseobacterium]|uniref:ClbS/DfsB family four-helix bundle protein n=1 Tax=unclassified Chryseobacterium TaxID=2593645 RepID=UPI00100BC3AF|nr:MULTISPECIES: ClbS/DfsB family four-helix bundle protein [unclassified Chryseobacterium]RXM53499.1 cytoplasmic protein [Chryseobacterium sp. CH25]RXM63607.1 cytoplasmic protein [Chryseobacterium sp. CH1]